MNGMHKALTEHYSTLETKVLERRLADEHLRSGNAAAVRFSILAKELRSRGSIKPNLYFHQR